MSTLPRLELGAPRHRLSRFRSACQAGIEIAMFGVVVAGLSILTVAWAGYRKLTGRRIEGKL